MISSLLRLVYNPVSHEHVIIETTSRKSSSSPRTTSRLERIIKVHHTASSSRPESSLPRTKRVEPGSHSWASGGSHWVTSSKWTAVREAGTQVVLTTNHAWEARVVGNYLHGIYHTWHGYRSIWG